VLYEVLLDVDLVVAVLLDVFVMAAGNAVLLVVFLEVFVFVDSVKKTKVVPCSSQKLASCTA